MQCRTPRCSSPVGVEEAVDPDVRLAAIREHERVAVLLYNVARFGPSVAMQRGRRTLEALVAEAAK